MNLIMRTRVVLFSVGSFVDGWICDAAGVRKMTFVNLHAELSLISLCPGHPCACYPSEALARQLSIIPRDHVTGLLIMPDMRALLLQAILEPAFITLISENNSLLAQWKRSRVTIITRWLMCANCNNLTLSYSTISDHLNPYYFMLPVEFIDTPYWEAFPEMAYIIYFIYRRTL